MPKPIASSSLDLVKDKISNLTFLEYTIYKFIDQNPGVTISIIKDELNIEITFLRRLIDKMIIAEYIFGTTKESRDEKSLFTYVPQLV